MINVEFCNPHSRACCPRGPVTGLVLHWSDLSFDIGNRGQFHGKRRNGTLIDPMTRMSTANVLGSAWPWSFLRRALLLATPGLDRLAGSTIVEMPFDSANKSAQTSVRMPQEKA